MTFTLQQWRFLRDLNSLTIRAASAALEGLFYGGGTHLLVAQAIGSAVVAVCTFVVAFAVMHALNLTGLLRVSEEGELYGLDLHEHGISATLNI